jgi:hypothetical protein
MAIVNQGNLAFAAGDDPTKHNLGSCSSTYRNAPGDSLLKVKYVDKTLTVSCIICIKYSIMNVW